MGQDGARWGWIGLDGVRWGWGRVGGGEGVEADAFVACHGGAFVFVGVEYGYFAAGVEVGVDYGFSYAVTPSGYEYAALRKVETYSSGAGCQSTSRYGSAGFPHAEIFHFLFKIVVCHNWISQLSQAKTEVYKFNCERRSYKTRKLINVLNNLDIK